MTPDDTSASKVSKSVTEPVDSPKLPMPWQGRLVILAGVVLVALNLRIAVAAVSPILSQVRHDIDLTDSLAGLLGTVPVVAFALFGSITPALARRVGLEPLMVIAMLTSVVGQVARAFAPSSLLFIIFSVVALSGMGMGNVLLPPLIKRYFPDRIGVVTSIYSAVMAVSTTIPPLFALQLSAVGGWRFSLASWSIVGLAASVPWTIVVIRSIRARRQDRGFLRASAQGEKAKSRHRQGGRVWRSPVAWGLAICFGMNSLNSYSMFAWLPQILIDAGLSAEAGAWYLAIFTGTGIPCALIMPIIGAKMRNPLPIVAFCMVSFVGGYLGLMVAPSEHTWLWSVLAGIGPGSFPLMLALINLRTRTSAGSTALSGFAQGVGYALAALGPSVTGVLYGQLSSWTIPLSLHIGTLVVLFIGAIFACRPRMLEDTWGGKTHQTGKSLPDVT